MLSEFSYVFPEDIPGFNLVREVDFGIDLVLETAPVSQGSFSFGSIIDEKAEAEVSGSFG